MVLGSCIWSCTALLPKIQTSIWKNSNIFNPLNLCCPLLRLSLTNFSTVSIYSGNVKIGELTRAGKVDAARHVFDKMPVRDVVTWNSMLTGYWQSGLIDESKRLFMFMPEKNVVSWNSMIAGCVENARMDEACVYFCKMPERNTSSWNAMISGFVRYGRIKEATRLFEEMPQRNVISYTAMMDGYAQNGEIERARNLFDQIPHRNAVSWTVMIRGYVDNENFAEAKALFEMMPNKNIVAITAMITGYYKEGEMENARCLFEDIRNKDLISWNAIIAGYEQNGNAEEALNMTLKMLEMGMKPDHSTLISVLCACSSLASLKQGRQFHVYVVKENLESHGSVCNALITMYNKCGSVPDAEAVFRQLDCPDLVSWNTIIAGYAHHGYYDKAIGSFDRMGSNSLKPDGITFLNILSACGHAGRVKESMNWFTVMVSDNEIAPRAEHYACLIDILCRAGQLVKAYKIIIQMPFEADAGIWGALLSACRVYSNVKLGELAAARLAELEPQNCGTYIMMSNIYAAAGMWKEVIRVRVLMKDKGIKKQPGHSWIEFENKVHFFLGGDISHPDIDKIHLELRRLGLQMTVADDYETV
ncbi:Pentatricopeptide repeat-containing protein [Thalictrum thalictroides]|uniref:Pentatricopeptide repeat-containing protein n=1 Tax=Thalictrum thalictroides TaxID=46969 RepID=A0A7J6XBV7_THATH|nr:Pentatricopeptide repeat-containing protein [Thalictrum thalictroides]